MNPPLYQNYDQLALKIKKIGQELGFSQIGITNTNLTKETAHFEAWVGSGHHGDMKYFEKHSEVYKSPQKLLPNATRIICCRIDYPKSKIESHPIASFAQIQDYSSHIRELFKKYIDEIAKEIDAQHEVRVFAGNAPVLEKALAAKAGLGWYGKNSVLINEDAGSYFFLGEILTDLPLPIDAPTENSCGSCFKCSKACPTNAIIAPHKLDARRCIAYLTVEHKGNIPRELRPLIGANIYGCDICQNVCPWNQKAGNNPSPQFKLSPDFISGDLVDWFLWDEKEFKEKTKHSPMHRLSHERWLRNIAIALGNSPKNPRILNSLKSRLDHPSPLVREHVEWAIGVRS